MGRSPLREVWKLLPKGVDAVTSQQDVRLVSSPEFCSLQREFYFDVHPPLGKMIVGLVGLLSGYNGHFEFKSGDVYKEDVPYIAMRVMLATFGVLMVPLAWYTSKELGFSNRGAHIVTLMVLCGRSTLTTYPS